MLCPVFLLLFLVSDDTEVLRGQLCSDHPIVFFLLKHIAKQAVFDLFIVFLMKQIANKGPLTQRYRKVCDDCKDIVTLS